MKQNIKIVKKVDLPRVFKFGNSKVTQDVIKTQLLLIYIYKKLNKIYI